MNEKKHFAIGGLVATVVIALVHLLVPGGWGSVFSPFRRAFTASGVWADSLVAVPVWLLCVLWALILTALGAALLLVISRRRKLEGQLPTIITKAEIFGLRWRWNYQEGEIRDITSYCPKCDREVVAKSENRHGFLHLISYACECRKWRSKSFQCSQAQMLERVCQAIQQKTSAQPVSINRGRPVAG